MVAGAGRPAGGDGTGAVGLLAAARELPPWLVTAYVRREARRLGASDAVVLLQDYDQAELVPLTDEAAAEPATGAVPVDGTLAGRAFATAAPVTEGDGAEARLHLPLVDGGERVGLLTLEVARPDGGAQAVWEEFAAQVAALIGSKGRATDVYFRARRRKGMSLAAEMQWQLLPPLATVDPRLAVAGLVEPAYNVGGDAFDYAINHETAHLAVFDAMGHGLDAAVMAAVAVTAYRHGRRSGVAVGDLYTLMDAEFRREFPDERFVTAQLATLHLPSGLLALVNAGHPAPLLVRDGSVSAALTGPVTLPVGLDGADPQVITAQLQPGDRILFYTDGVTESRRHGQSYGEDRLRSDVEHVLADALPLPELVRRLNLRQRTWRGGGDPDDDATLLLVEWRGPNLPRL